MEYTQQVDRYIFRRPLWRKTLPPFLLLFIWAIPALLWKGHLLRLPPPFDTWPTIAVDWITRAGITLTNSTAVAAALSAIIVIWWYKSFEILIISADAITRSSLFGFRRTLRWVDVDEVLIDHLEARMEGDATARKTLYLYEVPRGIFKLRRCLKVSNRQFDGFEDVERIAVLVSVPAVSERLRRRLETSRKPAVFSIIEPGQRLVGVLSMILGGATVFAAFYEPLWLLLQEYPHLTMIRMGIIVLGVAVFLYGFTRFLYKQVGVDMENVYVMRRRWITRRIPIDNIADIQIRENNMRIYAFIKDPEVPKQVFKTSSYVRNRGVMLRLIREVYDVRRAMDNAPIPTVVSANDTPAQGTPTV